MKQEEWENKGAVREHEESKRLIVKGKKEMEFEASRDGKDRDCYKSKEWSREL